MPCLKPVSLTCKTRLNILFWIKAIRVGQFSFKAYLHCRINKKCAKKGFLNGNSGVDADGGGGQVVSMLAFYSKEPSSYHAEVYNFYCVKIASKEQILI